MELEMKASGLGVLFHSDLLRGTPLSREIDRYSFFSYDVNEALLVSEKERKILLDCIDKIDYEMEYSIGWCVKTLITKNIKLFIDYCMRFYDRQFVTRSEVNHDVLVKFERLLDGYFKNADLRKSGLPQVRYFADKIYLSPNYFGDLIKKETGMTAQEYIQNKIVNVSKEWITNTQLEVIPIAYESGFQYSQHFSRIFKKNVGRTPLEYRKMQA